MGYRDYMAQLLRPLGLYELTSGFSGEELRIVGDRLDALENALDLTERESFLATAEAEGLEKWEELFPYRPVGDNAAQRRAAVSALMRIDGRSFTLPAINDTVSGCGHNAFVQESDTPMTVIVSFPDVRGVPDDFEELVKRVESILPCHLNVEYIFLYTTWADIQRADITWGQLDAMNLSWKEFEKYIW